MDDLIERLNKAEVLLRDALETPHADAVKDARAKIASDAATIARLTDALKGLKALLVIEQLAPAILDFEKENRAKARDALIAQAELALATPSVPGTPDIGTSSGEPAKTDG